MVLLPLGVAMPILQIRTSRIVEIEVVIHVFFQEIVLWRNHLINRVVLFEEKSILVLPECLEAC